MRKKAFMILLLLCVLALPFPQVFAEGAFTFEEEPTGEDMPLSQEGTDEKDTLFITVESDTQIQRNDKVLIHIKGDSGKEEDLNIDLYSAAVDVEELRLLPGRYSVSDIQYKGTNRLIESYGFGVDKQFLVGGSGDNYLTIYIGEKKAAGITSKTHLLKQDGKVQDSLKAPSSDGDVGTEVNTQESGDADEDGEEGAGSVRDNSTGDSRETLVAGESPKDPAREEVVEKAGKKDVKKVDRKPGAAGIFNKLVVVFLFATAVGGFLFIWWRKNSR